MGATTRRRGGGIVMFAVCAAGLVETSCYPTAGPAPGALTASSVTWASKRWPGVTAGSLAGGRDLFLAKCDGCHSYPELTAIPDERWPSIMESMARKSALVPEERDSVLHYILASRSEAK